MPSISSPLLFESKFLTLETGDLPLSLAEADFNGDGAQDIVVSSWDYPEHGRLILIPGRGDGTFEDFKTIATASDLAWGPVVATDLNADGRMDLVALDESGARVFLGNGDGTFIAGQVVPVPFGYRSWVIATDLNQDGKPDIVISTGGLYVLPGIGDGTFGPAYTIPQAAGASGVAVSDFDRNGIPDLAIARYDADSTTILLGTGGGQFGRVDLPAGFGPAGIAAGDINGDGYPDFAVANGGWWCGDTVRRDSTVTVYLAMDAAISRGHRMSSLA